MGAIATLTPARLPVLPGGRATVTVEVRNTGTLVDEMSFEVLGAPAAWATVEPPTLALYPGSTAEVVLTFAPPREASIAPEAVAFGLRVLCKEDVGGATVEEGVLDVGAFADLSAELLPRTSRSRRWGKHEVAIDNRGNTPVEVAVLATEGQGKCEVRLDDPSATVGPGQAAFVGVRVRGVKRIWKGAGVSHPVKVVVDDAAGRPIEVDGTFAQEAVIPRWLPKLVAALVLLGVAAAALWLTLLKPVIKDEAKTQAQKTAQQAGAAAGAAAGKKAGAAAAGGGGPAAPTPTPTPKRAGATNAAITLASPGKPFFTRLVATAADQKPQVLFDAKTVLSLTDIVFENPNGDTGQLTLSCGDQILLTPNLGNFRDLDQHQVAPILCGPSQPLVLTVKCQTPGAGTACTPSVSVAGYVNKPSPSPSASPTPAA